MTENTAASASVETEERSNGSESQAVVQKAVKKRTTNRRTPDLNTVLKTMQSCSTDAERIEILKNSYDTLHRKYETVHEKRE